MKFDNFVKYAGSNGTIFEANNGDKWLFYDKVGMKIPEGRNVCGKSFKMPVYMEDLIYKYDDYDEAELTAAHVPNAYSKPSELLRTFTGGDLSIDLYNKAFGFIEKEDLTYINQGEYPEDDMVYTVLLISSYYGDDKEFKMIYVESEDL